MHISGSVQTALDLERRRRSGLPRSEAREPTPAAALPAATPPVRLRFVLVLALVAWGLIAGYPRMQAAFRLHDATVATADYGLCMVGPTGPSLLRDKSADFQRLVRRRLVASGPSERPFNRCAKLARSVTGDVERERLHTLTAAEFREYAGRGGAALAELGVSATPLAQLCADAWPFARGGYTQLMKPSLGAHEAAHVPTPARPAQGRGLPARSGVYRNVWREGAGFGLALGSGSDTALLVTADRGLNFRPLASAGAFEAHAERCASPDGRKVYRLSPREDGGAQQVLFSLEGAEATTSELAPMSERILGSGCDERSLVALTADRERLHLRLCPFAGRCGELPLPATVGAAPAAAVDVAKLKGTVVLSAAQDGVVRVVSSRDEGRTFTPPIVAFDAAEYPELGMARRAPTRLVALGERLLLVGAAAKGGDGYPVLASDDQGVSFRAP